MKSSAEKRLFATTILMDSSLVADDKLFLILQLYKEELQANYPQIYYAGLEWKEEHRKNLYCTATEKYLKDILEE